MIPLATTTITVLRDTDADLDAEPYSGAGLPQPVAEDVRAVIYRPASRVSGRETLAGGEESITDFDMVCDLVELRRTDAVRDNTSEIVYRVVWFITYPGEHVEAGLRVVEGEV